jgi:hypothetical protein
MSYMLCKCVVAHPIIKEKSLAEIDAELIDVANAISQEIINDTIKEESKDLVASSSNSNVAPVATLHSSSGNTIELLKEMLQKEIKDLQQKRDGLNGFGKHVLGSNYELQILTLNYVIKIIDEQFNIGQNVQVSDTSKAEGSNGAGSIKEKKEAIEFAEWIGERYVWLHEVWCPRFRDQRDKSNWYTTEQLYQIFKQSQSTTN